MAPVTKGERMDLTINSGTAVCALPPDRAKDVKLEMPKQLGTERTAANGQPMVEMGSEIPALTFRNGDVDKLRFKVVKVHIPLVAVSKIASASDEVTFQPESAGGSYIESLSLKSRKHVFEKSGIYMLPSWAVTKQTGSTVAPVDETPNKEQAKR